MSETIKLNTPLGKTAEDFAYEIIETYFNAKFTNQMLRPPFLAKLIISAIREARAELESENAKLKIALKDAINRPL